MNLLKSIQAGFIAVIISADCAGQTPLIDSLKKNIEKPVSDNEKLSSVILLTQQSINPDSLLPYVLLAESIAVKSAERKDQDKAAYCRIGYYAKKNISDSALLLLDGMLKAYKKNNKEQPFYLQLLFIKSKILDRASQYTQALSQLVEVLEVAASLQDTLTLVQAKTGIGWVQMEMEQYGEALQWFYRAKSTSADQRFYKNYGALYSNIATAHNYLGHPDSARYYINIAITDARENGNRLFLATALSMQAKIFIDSRQAHLAEKPLNEVVQIRKQLNDPFYIVYDMSTLASYYASNNQPEKGIALCKEGIAIAKEKGLPSQLLMIYQSLADNYKAAGDNTAYSRTLESILHLKDSFNNINSSKMLADLQSATKAREREKLIGEQELNLTRKNYWLVGSVIFTAMAGIIAWLFFRFYRKRQRLQLEVALAEEKRNAADAVKHAEEKERIRIAADLHDNLGVYAASLLSNLSYISLDQNQEVAAGSPVHELGNNAHAIISELNDTIWVLKKDLLSLTAISDRIKLFISRIRKSYPGIQIEVLEDIRMDQQLPSSQAFHLYRILQEAVNNALRHSQGKNILVEITSKESWRISVTDDGSGFHPADPSTGGGNGLDNMRERSREAGWDITWRPGAQGGTVVEIAPTTN